MASEHQNDSRLKRLLQFLERDPKNLVLLADAANAAADAQAFGVAEDLLSRYEACEPLSPALENLRGTMALSEGRFDDAAAIFERVLGENHDAPAVRFNLAWAHAMAGRYQVALDLLDDDTVAASPRAPALKVQMLHHLDRYEDGLACGEMLLTRFPDNAALLGALATLAMDAEKPQLARAYAEKAGPNSDASAALGMLMLGDYEAGNAIPLFDQAIALQPSNPRAWIGKGLALQASGDTGGATEAIDRGAELFRDHLGSWIAAGWAHFVRGDYKTARARFDTAMAIDANFSECHGGIAVVDVVEGDIESAKRECDIALRLDRNCFGGALAKSMLLERGGNDKAAQKVRDIAMNVPIGPNGQTITQALSGFAGRRR
jgi:tetratricopeptide (TPR) repeat protein